MVSSKTPAPITKRLQDALATAQHDPAYQASLAKQGASGGRARARRASPSSSSKDAAKWKAIIKAAGIKVE